MSLGFTEILLIIVAVVLLFGPKRIPELAKALGRATHEFKRAKSVMQNETRDLIEAAEKHAEAEKDA